METALLIFKSKSGDKVVELTEGIVLFAGRTVECDICLPSPSVSRKHAVFLMRGGQCGVKDLSSSNGTFLNGKRLSRPVRLRDGDTVHIGSYTINFAIAHVHSFMEAGATMILGAAVPAALAVRESTAASEETAANEFLLEEAAATEPPRRRSEATVRLIGRAGGEEQRKESSRNTAAGIAISALRQREETPNAPKSETVILAEEIGDGSVDEAFVYREDVHEDAHANGHDEEREKALLLGDAPEDAGMLPGEPEGGLSVEDAPAEGEPIPDEELTTDAADDEDDEAENAAIAAIAHAEEDEEEEEGAAAAEGEDASAAAEKADFSPVFDAVGSVSLPPPREVDPNAMPVDQAFKEAVETRLYLYSFLGDMQKERKDLLAAQQAVPDALASELDRQDREMLKIPPPEKAEQMIEARINRRNALKEKIAEAKKNGTAMPPRPSKAMRQAEDIAINQWTIIAQSGKEALPKAIEEGFRTVADEPLADTLRSAEIDPTMLMGGAAYYLALEQFAEEAKYNRAFLRVKLAELPDPEEKKPVKSNGLFGKKKKSGEEETPAAALGETYEELSAAEAHMANRAAWIAQEMGSLEPMLIKEFWSVYTKASLRFQPNPREITLALRAFLRYGVIGFMPWWMPDDVCEHVMADCSKNIVDNMFVSRETTNILYADEYIGAVMRCECTPAPDENLEINAKNSPEWKADKALRKLINTRSQMRLLTEVADSLQSRIDKLDKEGGALDDRIKGLLPGQKNFKQIKSELGMQRQALKVESTKLSKLSEKIWGETLAQLKEVEADTEARFNSGELPRPSQDFLIEREVDAMRKIGRLLANLKERFLPLVMRDSFKPGTDAVNDRGAMQTEITDIERRDPRIFLETLVDSKKKANRVDIRISPVFVLIPSAGVLTFSWGPRYKPEDGRLAIPACFIRQRIRERQLMYLFSDFRWDTSKANAGMDVMASDTIVSAFMGVRWDWRKRSKEGREKGLVYTDQNDRTNWRRVYEAYMSTAFDSGKKLFNRNYDFYERIIGKYFDLPEGVELLRK